MMKGLIVLVQIFLVSTIIFRGVLFAQNIDTLKNYENKKTALVLGNSNYSIAPLRNPKNDADSIAKALKELGFMVLSHTNSNRSGMMEAIQAFGDSIRNNPGVGLFYYAGHGIQYEGANYLVPVDSKIERSYQIVDQCIRADQVLRMMELYKNPMNIIILDACRNNPYPSISRELNKGLAQPEEAPVGSLIAFATAPGSVASDGDGVNGLYTQELLRAIRIPGLNIEQVFKEVRNNVLGETNGEQIPWENSSLRGDFYFTSPNLDVSVNNVDCKDLSSLYIGCANEMKITIPNLGKETVPTFHVKGGTIIESRKDILTIVPGVRVFDSTTVQLSILSGDIIVGKKEFKIIPIPPPRFVLNLNGEPIIWERGPSISTSNLDSLELSVDIIPNEMFSKLLPKESKYVITDWEVILAFQARMVDNKRIRNESKCTLDFLAEIAKPGMRLVVEIKAIKRLDYSGELVSVNNLRNNIFTLQVN